MNNRSTTAKARMRAAVQGLEEEESDEGEIEVVDFTDGKSNTYVVGLPLLKFSLYRKSGHRGGELAKSKKAERPGIAIKPKEVSEIAI